MPDPLLKQGDDMGIIHGIKNFLALSPELYEPHLAKAP
jgi:hypothetical protein